jgi:hypothetical protein
MKCVQPLRLCRQCRVWVPPANREMATGMRVRYESKTSQKTLHEKVYSRLLQIEDLLVYNSDYRYLYHLLRKLASSFSSCSFLSDVESQEGPISSMETILFSQEFSEICEWFQDHFQIPITEQEAKTIKNYLKICSRDISFNIYDPNELFVLLTPPPISEYSSWCQRLRYLRSQPQALLLPYRKLFVRKKKAQKLLLLSHPPPAPSGFPTLTTSRISPDSSPSPTPRAKKALSTLRLVTLPPLASANLKKQPSTTSLALVASSRSLPSLSSSPCPPLISPLSWKAKVRLVATENEQIRKEVFKTLGVTP